MKSVKKLIIIYSLFQAVLCREFSITLPESVEALRGLCVLIPCRFQIEEQYDKDLQRDSTGIWLLNGIDGNSNKVFNSKVTTENKIEGEIIGDLLMKNCTTIFYNISERDRGKYYFRLEATGSLKYNYRSPVSLRVRDSPIRPSITLYKEDQGEVEDQNEVVEGTSVSLICSAPSAPCLLNPPTFTWNFLPEERRQEQNHNTSFSSSQLNFNATHLHHGLTFTCTTTYQLQNQNKSAQSSRTLHVLYGPRNTSVSVSPSASVLLGSSVSLSCSSDANPAVLNYIWYRENGEQIGTGNHLTINTTDSTHRGLYYCRAQNQHGDHNSSVVLDVQYGPRNTSVSVSPSASVLLGSSVSLSCSSDANPAVLNYTWYRENGEQIGTGNHLTINTTDSTHRGLYYCRAQNQHGDHNSSVVLDLQYAPQVSSSSSCNSMQDMIMCSCEVHGNPSPKLDWRLSGQTLSSSEATNISLESVGDTGLRSLISIQKSVNGVHTLQCVGANELGVASLFLSFMNKAPCSDKGSGVDVPSVLIGAAVGASVMMMLCGVFLCVRKATPSQSGQEEEARRSMVDNQEEDEDSVYANKTVLSESLHYSTIVFPNGAGSEIRGLSKLTAEYANIGHASNHQTMEGATGSAFKEVQEENNINTDSEKMCEEEVTYGNITRQPMMEQTPSDLGENGNNEIKQLQIEERDSEHLKQSDEAEGF
ncbi:myelin-associated glycoprotein-like [Hemibagrus wyckioides]|nr:myelin-associated glycoprotein-like [Hemibagrus wyckioides]XP_058273169.1 myelin-associated glycoprotein-like [Hemibagrus wyckioides]XP_058273170.1 myelin-associated glycoprotein-like [Hemibagrus wyckioides]